MNARPQNIDPPPLLTTDVMQGEAAHKQLVPFLLRMHKEVGRGVLNIEKAYSEMVWTCENEAAFGVFHKDLLIASVALTRLDLFYTDALFWIDKWLYVLPEYRDLDDRPIELLLQEVQWFCDTSGRPAILTLFNEKRARPRGKFQTIGKKLCYYPAGSVIELEPGGDSERNEHNQPIE